MKVEIFVPVSYYGPVEARTWPTPPRQYDPVHGMRSMEHGFEQCEAAHRAGFDSLNFAEHHYSINQLSPSPIFYAGLLGQRLPDARTSASSAPTSPCTIRCSSRRSTRCSTTSSAAG